MSLDHDGHNVHDPSSTRRMAATSLADMPPEIQLQIAEFTPSNQAMKALSITCRRLRIIAQYVLFRTLSIDLEKGKRGSIDDLLANPRICASVRVLRLYYSPWFFSEPFHACEEELSLLKNLLLEMVGLRGLKMINVDLSGVLLDAFLEIAAKVPLMVYLNIDSYPPKGGGAVGKRVEEAVHTHGMPPAPNLPLRISKLDVSIYLTQPDFYQFLLRATATTLTRLDLAIYEDILMKFEGIILPCLRELVLFVRTPGRVPITNGAGFIIAQRTITLLYLDGDIGLPPFPPDALPNLRTISGPTKLLRTLIPGRPVEMICVYSKQADDPNWLKEEITQSTAPVTKIIPTPHWQRHDSAKTHANAKNVGTDGRDSPWCLERIF